MVFNSIFFIFCFLPVFMLIYYLVPGKLRNLLLFLGSLIFYAWGEPVYVILMLFSSVFNYYMGTELERLYYDDKKQKLNLVFAIIINLGILVFFKYYGFLLDTFGGITGIHISHPELSLPIGLSFYTFRNLSYLFDIYIRLQHNRTFLPLQPTAPCFLILLQVLLSAMQISRNNLRDVLSIFPALVQEQNFLLRVLQKKYSWLIIYLLYMQESAVILKCLCLPHGLEF